MQPTGLMEVQTFTAPLAVFPKDTLKDVKSRTGGDLFEISEDVACSTVKQKLTF